MQTIIDYDALKKTIFITQDGYNVYGDKKFSVVNLITNFFPRLPNLFSIDFHVYEAYINQLKERKKLVQNRSNFILDYMILHSKYEIDYILMKNLYIPYFDPIELIEECNNLLEKYEYSEKLLFLKADIEFKLCRNFGVSNVLYQNIKVAHCPYGDYMTGVILSSYCPSEQVNYVLSRSTDIKDDYYMYWYLLGKFYLDIGDVNFACKHFSRVVELLKNKFENNLLSPRERQYLSSAIRMIGFCTYDTEYYDEDIKKIEESIYIDKYSKIMFSDILNDKDYSVKLCYVDPVRNI